jgi:hypothetical protein
MACEAIISYQLFVWNDGTDLQRVANHLFGTMKKMCHSGTHISDRVPPVRAGGHLLCGR